MGVQVRYAGEKVLENLVDRKQEAGLVMGTIMLDHKMGGMLDHDLIEENL